MRIVNRSRLADNLFDSSGDKLSEFGIRRRGIAAAVGRELGTWGEGRLDNVHFPHSRGDLRIGAIAGLEELGSDRSYEQGIAEGSLAYTRGRYTGLFGGLLASTRESDAPYQSQFRLGGEGIST